MKNHKNLFLIFIICWYFANNLIAQQLYSEFAQKRRDVYKIGSSNPASNGLGNELKKYLVGHNETELKRALYQWDLTNIPDYSDVQSVMVWFAYEPPSSSQQEYFNPKFFDVGLDLDNPDLNDIWSKTNPDSHGLGELIANDHMYYNRIYSGPNDPFVLAIEEALLEDKFTLGIIYKYETPNYPSFLFEIQNYVSLEITYTLPQTVVDQIFSTGDRAATFKIWQNPWSEPFYPPQTFQFPLESEQVIQANQGFHYNSVNGLYEKYNKWNDIDNVVNPHIFEIIPENFNLVSKFKPTYSDIYIKNSMEQSEQSFGTLKFKDPWLTDYNHPTYGMCNQGMESAFYTLNSPFNPNLSSNYMGLFLNQDYNYHFPFYSVQAITPQVQNMNGRNYKFYFLNWSVNFPNYATIQYPNALTTAIVFRNENAVIKANFKGTQLSNDQYGFSNNSQNKFVRSNDGYLHHVYKSMGYIWYETSTDNGSTWKLMNDGQPIINEIKAWEEPSIAISNDSKNLSFITFAEEALIHLYIFQYESDEISQVIQLPTQVGYRTPSIAYTANGSVNKIFIVFKGDDGLYYKAYYNPDLNSFFESWGDSDPILIDNTDAYSYTPALASDQYILQLAWEQRDGQASDIYYYEISDHESSISFDTFSILSDISSYPKNHCPSLISLGNTARVIWKGFRNNSDGLPDGESTVVFRDPDVERLWTFGYNVSSSHINKKEDNSYYAFAWSENDGQINKVANNRFLIRTLGTQGKYVQVNNSNNTETMFCNAFQTKTQPYSFSLINIAPSSKITGLSIASGREAVVYKDKAHFYYALGDISVDGEGIEFVEVDDTVNINTLGLLNQSLISQPFPLNENSSFLFSLQNGITDSAAAASVLDEDDYVKFKVALIDEETGSVIGLFNEVTYDKSNFYRFNNITYEVNTAGIGNRTVRLKLMVENNFSADYSLIQKYNNENVMGKTSIREMKYSGSLSVTDYSLSQNYPNPFNPRTTINYQIPKEGMVTLKVYDILGKEVKSLVNEYKSIGSYSVSFDASELASGVYIYQIRSNDFVSTRKMTLVK